MCHQFYRAYQFFREQRGVSFCSNWATSTCTGIESTAFCAIGEFDASVQVCSSYSADNRGDKLRAEQLLTVKKIRTQTEEALNLWMKTAKDRLPERTLQVLEYAKIDGASTWLSVLPTDREDRHLSPRVFHDSLALRNGWEPKHLPPRCMCDATLSLSHLRQLANLKLEQILCAMCSP
ncbi:hypothetical protein GJ496_008490 [Pomphorhynchus laevis]|nr:hypothetical protein GJ496_008490 [Pomphorhynchus laevis]